jgi:1,2-diacylglycerol 3-beta-glucosyltransferase
MLVLDILYLAGLIYIALATGWLALLTAGSWMHKEKVDRKSAPLKLGVLIPAYNEELEIYTTIQNIRNCDYPEELLQIIVLADNCSDGTAETARSAGVQVVERHDETRRGKGVAIDWFLKTYNHLYQDLDGICFVDADVLPDEKMFRELSASLSHPEVRVVQGFNGVANPYENWRTALNAIAFNVFNHVRMAGNNKLFGTSSLRGLGMAFDIPILQKYGWPAYSVVEDTEFTLMLQKDRINVEYNPAAIITSEMAGSRLQADRQRQRWEGGRFALASQVLPGLTRKVLSGQFRYFHIIMDLVIPPLSLLVIMLFFWSCLAFFLYPTSWPLFVLFFAVLFLYVASGQFQRHASLKLWGYLIAAPFFIFWKLLIYVKMICTPRSLSWGRTIRKAEIEKNGEK